MPSPVLGYGRKKPPSVTFRRVALLIAAAVLLAALAKGGMWSYRQIAAIIERRRLVAAVMMTQAACANYVGPPGAVVYDDSPGARVRLSGPMYGFATGDWGTALPTAAGSRPPCYDAYVDALKDLGVQPERNVIGAIALLHTLTSPQGKQTILAGVVCGPDPDFNSNPKVVRLPYSIRFYRLPIQTPKSLAGTTAPSTGAMEMLPLFFNLPRAQSLQVMAATLDPADPSHVIIPVVVGGKPGEVHVWSRDDGQADLRTTFGAVTQRFKGDRPMWNEWVLDEATIDPNEKNLHRGPMR